MSKVTWTGAVNYDWADAGNWSSGVPDASSDVVIGAVTSTTLPVASASIGTVTSITNSSSLYFQWAGTNTVTTFLDNTGSLNVDQIEGSGGTILNIGETLTNGGSLSIGNTLLLAPDAVTAAALDNTGSIDLIGSSTNQALLDVAGSAGFGIAGVLSGHVQLSGDSAIEFASGGITSLAAHASLVLNGKNAFIEDGSTGSNSALTGLASIGAGAILGLHRAAVSTTGSLANDGNIRLDTNGGNGGSSLTLAGALTNSGSLTIGNATLFGSDKVTATALHNTGSINLTGFRANQALLDVSGSAGFGTAEVLSGNVALTGDSAIEFTGGQIATIATGSGLTLSGKGAVIEDSTALGSSSALTGLSDVSGALNIGGGASMSVTGSLTNSGSLQLGSNQGGLSTLSVAGALTNTGSIDLNNGSGSDILTVGALSNSGSIFEGIDYTGAHQALLDVTTGVAGFGTPGILTGSVNLQFAAQIEFASGQISTIATAATVELFGTNSLIEDSTALGSNSALAGLSDIAGSLYLEGATVSTTGPLTISGTVGLDALYSQDGAATLSIGGALTVTNTGTLEMGGGRTDRGHSVTATSFVNSGKVDLNGDLTNALTVGNDHQQRLDFRRIRDRGTRRSGRRQGVLQPQRRQPSFRLERLGGADHQRDRHRRAHPRQGAVIRRYDQGFRDRRHDRRDELSLVWNDVQFRREFGGHRRHAQPDRWEPDRQYPDDGQVFELGFHPRPR
jgi:hypothetical protein